LQETGEVVWTLPADPAAAALVGDAEEDGRLATTKAAGDILESKGEEHQGGDEVAAMEKTAGSGNGEERGDGGAGVRGGVPSGQTVSGVRVEGEGPTAGADGNLAPDPDLYVSDDAIKAGGGASEMVRHAHSSPNRGSDAVAATNAVAADADAAALDAAAAADAPFLAACLLRRVRCVPGLGAALASVPPLVLLALELQQLACEVGPKCRR
jgi:hypothetical protein